MNSSSTTVQSSRQTCPTLQQAYSEHSGYILHLPLPIAVSVWQLLQQTAVSHVSPNDYTNLQIKTFFSAVKTEIGGFY